MENVWLNPRFACLNPKTAIFSDRDGTLIQHHEYLNNPDDVELLPGVKIAVQEILKCNIPFFIFTNQSGVGRGFFTIDRVHACQERLFELLDIEIAAIAGWCIAPESPDVEDGYRKPSPRFINQACAHSQISPTEAHVIGDNMVDLETAWGTGARAWGVECGLSEMPDKSRANKITGEHELRHDFASCVQSILWQHSE